MVTTKKSIILYGTDWCAACTRAKNQLLKHHLDFEFINIDHNPESATLVELLNGGMRSVPTLIFPDDSIMVEPSPQVLETKLKLYR